MEMPFERKKHRLGLLYGLVAGIAFSFFAWGLDAIRLANAHVAYPFAKFVPALIFCGLVGAAIGWLTIRLNRWYMTVILWLVFAVLGVWLMLWLPIEFSAEFLSRQSPIFAQRIAYPMINGVDQFRIIGMLVVGVLMLICGSIESTVVEHALSTANGGVITIVLICVLLMGIAGLGVDDMINKPFREPVQVLDDLFDFAIANHGKEVDITLARKKHLSAVEDITDLLLINGRRITLIGFDPMLGQLDFLVDFHGTWVRCTTIYSQPTDCILVEELSHKYYSSPVEKAEYLYWGIVNRRQSDLVSCGI